MARGRCLDRPFYTRTAPDLAPDLLGKVLEGPGGRAGRIVEVEAYRGADDPASHAHGGPTPRTEVMFGPPGRLYVYFSYGIHWCANVVAETDGTAGAVLIRALTPLRGIDAMAQARGPAARRRRDLCSGPAKLTAALGITGDHNGADLVTGDLGVTIRDDGTPVPAAASTPRVGISQARERSWRWYVDGVDDVSRGPVGDTARRR